MNSILVKAVSIKSISVISVGIKTVDVKSKAIISVLVKSLAVVTFAVVAVFVITFPVITFTINPFNNSWVSKSRGRFPYQVIAHLLISIHGNIVIVKVLSPPNLNVILSTEYGGISLPVSV